MKQPRLGGSYWFLRSDADYIKICVRTDKIYVRT